MSYGSYSEIIAEAEKFRLMRVIDEMAYSDEDMFGDLSDLTEKNLLIDARRMAEQNGVWGIVLEKRCPCCKNWHVFESVWCCIPSDEDERDLLAWAGYFFDIPDQLKG